MTQDFSIRTANFQRDQIRGTVCGWRDCGATAPFDHLPAGWRVIVVARGSLIEVQNLLRAPVDRVLCPRHYRELAGYLKVTIPLATDVVEAQGHLKNRT